jgi:hypothetical protein
MKVFAQALVLLPFTLDLCAIGSEAPPIEWQNGNTEFALRFPPSLVEGTCGKSIYPNGWAWWTGDRLAIEASMPIDASGNNLEALRAQLLLEMNQAVRRFLNSYRVRFHRPDVHPVVIDPSALSLYLEYEDGHREALPDPVDSLSHHSLPSEPPLERSVNETTIAQLAHDLEIETEQPLAAQLALDSEWLRAMGEPERAEAVDHLVSRLSNPSMEARFNENRHT